MSKFSASGSSCRSSLLVLSRFSFLPLSLYISFNLVAVGRKGIGGRKKPTIDLGSLDGLDLPDGDVLERVDRAAFLDDLLSD